MPFFNPFRPAYIENPYPALDALRREAPVFRSPDLRAWVVTSYEHSAEVLREHTRFSANRVHAAGEMAQRMAEDVARQPLQLAPLSGLDAPEHTRLRHLVNAAFNPAAVAALRPAIEAETARLLDALPATEPFDVIPTFAEPLPAAIVLRMLGFDGEQGEHAARLLNTIENVRSMPAAAASFIAQSAAALDELRGMFDSLPAGTGLVVTLRDAQASGAIDGDEVISLAAHIATVGLAPTTAVIVNSLLSLASNAEQRDLLAADPSLIPAAVHELIRYDCPLHSIPRLAVDDTELGGRRIRAGEPVFVIAGAANRDPAMFPDPATLDVTRDARQHLGFGMGPHLCLGAPLARLIVEVALAAVLERMPRFVVAPNGTRRLAMFERRTLSRLVLQPG